MAKARVLRDFRKAYCTSLKKISTLSAKSTPATLSLKTVGTAVTRHDELFPAACRPQYCLPSSFQCRNELQHQFRGLPENER